MAQEATDLQQLKGVGSILAKRLHDAGYDSFNKIAQDGEEGLRKIRGITPRAIGSIVEQARQLAAMPPPGHPEREQAVKEQLAEVREKIQTLAQSARDRHQEQLTGKTGRKLTADLVRMEDALGQLRGGGKKRSKRTAKALMKVEKRVSGLDDAGLKKIHKSLKRARKAVMKAL